MNGFTAVHSKRVTINHWTTEVRMQDYFNTNGMRQDLAGEHRGTSTFTFSKGWEHS
uniref:Uncharacterized protein n=1 Tax=Anguilla anguilla TaxID=7936 RepID=A0A0E9TXJ6_ANGAN